MWIFGRFWGGASLNPSVSDPDGSFGGRLVKEHRRSLKAPLFAFFFARAKDAAGCKWRLLSDVVERMLHTVLPQPEAMIRPRKSRKSHSVTSSRLIGIQTSVHEDLPEVRRCLTHFVGRTSWAPRCIGSRSAARLAIGRWRFRTSGVGHGRE